MKRWTFAGTVMLAALAGGPVAAWSQSQAAPYRAYVDPQTGKLAAPPEEAPAPDTGRVAAPEPFVVEPGKTDAGGVMVDVRGRLTHSMQATLGPDGKVTTDCIEKRAGQ